MNPFGGKEVIAVGTISDFMDQHFLHFNSRELVAAARAYKDHVGKGGKMLLSLAGAMSTARIGKTLSRMIRKGYVHAISCTGANLEEDIFTLLAGKEYKLVPNWRYLKPEEEKSLYEQGLNRVTDTCIPETVMRHVEKRLLLQWETACKEGTRSMPSEYLMSVMNESDIEQHFQLPKEESWLLAAKDMQIPVYTPGWEDSTTGNVFAAAVIKGSLANHQCVQTGTEQMQHLIEWYLKNNGQKTASPSVGFFQIGGGIAGDFAICAVPTIIQDMKLKDTPFWDYMCQISDAITSYGGYSGAVPNEKITWGKLDVDTPKFMIQSDATIVAPLMFAYILGD